MNSQIRRFKRLWTKSPKDNWLNLVGRVTHKETREPDWLAGKHAKWNTLTHYLELFRRFSEKAGVKFQLKGKRVMEIGGGPVLGVGPFALIEGAAGFTLIEPGFRECRNEESFRDHYLFPLYTTHARVWQAEHPLDFQGFLKRIDTIEASTTPMEQYTSEGSLFDVVVSKSCLEHIADLDQAIEVCHRVSNPGSIHAHYIDFTMHRDEDRVGSPFGLMFKQSKAQNPEHLSQPNGIINLLRATEMTAMFERRFSSVRFFPLEDYSSRISVAERHSDWQGYSSSDLGIANGVMIAIK
jgi:hypothetical protein